MHKLNYHKPKHKMLGPADPTIGIFYLNIRSLNANLEEMMAYLELNNIDPSVIVLSETWQNDSSVYSRIKGFNNFFSSNERNKSSGVAIFIKECFTVEKEYSDKSLCFDNLTIDMGIEKEKFSVTALYNSPSNETEKFLMDFEKFLSHSNRTNKHVIMGDFNIDTMSSKTCAKDLVNVCNSFDWTLADLNSPTRVTELTSTCIDHVITNYPVISSLLKVWPCDVTDHFGIMLQTGLDYKDKHNQNTYLRRSTKKMNDPITACNALFYAKHCLGKTNFDNIEINEGIDILVSCILETMDKYFPLESSKPQQTSKNPPWLNRHIKNRIRHRQFLYKKSLEDPILIQKYRACRANCSKLIRKQKMDWKKRMCEKLLRGKNGEFFKYIRRKKSQNKNICELDSNVLNDYFTKVGSNLAEEIPQNYRNFNTKSCEKSIFLSPTNTFEIFNTCAKMTNSHSEGLDHINNNFMKFFNPVIAEPLSILLNRCMTTGIFPKRFKIAKVCPLFKSGQRNDPSNYRPISILPSLSKIFEKIIHTRISNFLETTKQIPSEQYGFQKKKSTVDALLTHVEKIRNFLDRKIKVSSVFLDLRKAFDTVDHGILLKKLENAGIRGIPLELMKNYMEERYQYVENNSQKSNIKKCTIGVPQGSILGPLLFLIYVSDLPCCIDNRETFITMFADDTTITTATKSNNTDLLTSTVNVINQWMCQNRLSVNTSKSSLLNFGLSKKKIGNILTEGGMIESKPFTKYLGILIDEKLNFKHHILHVAKKIAKLCGLLKFIRDELSIKQRVTFYKMYIQPVIAYGILIYGCTAKNNLDPILKLQKRILRIIYNKPYMYPTRNLFQRAGLLTVHELFIRELLKFAVKNYSNFPSSENERVTRSTKKCLLKQVTPRTNFSKFSVQNLATKIVNNLKNVGIWSDDLISSCLNIREKCLKKIIDCYVVGNRDVWSLLD